MATASSCRAAGMLQQYQDSVAGLLQVILMIDDAHGVQQHSNTNHASISETGERETGLRGSRLHA